MSLPHDEILPEEPTGEIVHWMDAGHQRGLPGGVPAAATTAFLVGVAATLGGFLLWRYLAPRREALPPWRWGRGPLH
ncbi:hypothetical protein LRS10_09965 [Phenylobacterium sp. J426]|uniref:hypothetical protein n=1 Tax=Phenylobacterium sp. J426 TaxID=2898439 RepID=UPI002150C820|nr:hypothetical protein [Phenylobacterium sp. J426]MCR5874467.1 hypothetical protein [Phenylobacterium sp. J426]